MAKGKGKGKKDPFEDLDKEFKDAVNGMNRDEARARAGKIALDQADFDAAEKEDQDLKDKREIAAHAGAVYTDAKKFNKLRIRYLRKRLADIGATASQVTK